MSLTGPDVETILLTARSSSPLQTYETQRTDAIDQLVIVKHRRFSWGNHVG